jgi:hypothetical protein
MTADGTRYPFASFAIAAAPEDAGIYTLWEGKELVYVGAAIGGEITIRSRLAEHLEGIRSCGECRPTHYSWELARNALVRENEFLRQYREAYAALPRCNSSGVKQAASGAIRGFSPGSAASPA